MGLENQFLVFLSGRFKQVFSVLKKKKGKSE